MQSHLYFEMSRIVDFVGLIFYDYRLINWSLLLHPLAKWAVVQYEDRVIT
jgi:hypothetical protein